MSTNEIAVEDAHVFTRAELERRLSACRNRTLEEIDLAHVFAIAKHNSKVTGIVGKIIEQSVLGYPADNRQAPDLLVDGIPTELKTTGIRLKKKTTPPIFEAKEPMSITAVSPDNIVSEEFANSHFWKKLEHLLLVYYHYDADKTVSAAEYARFLIKGYDFHTFSPDDAEILRQDWTLVRDFLRQLQEEYDDAPSQYPRLSSELRAQLLFIDTAPKWPNPPRFRLKRSVVSAMVRRCFGDTLEQLPDKYNSYAAIDAKLHALSLQYAGKTIRELKEEFHIPDGKAMAEAFVVSMFGGTTRKMSTIELFQEIGLIGKTITLTQRGTRTEDMKLFPIDFDELTEAEFEDSEFYDYFANHQFLYIVFEEPSAEAHLEENRFLGFKRFFFDETFIEEEVKPIRQHLRDLIINRTLRDVPVLDKRGNPIINKKSGTARSAPNFPKSSEGLLFLRGTGADASDKTLKINGIAMLRQNLWIKGSFMAKTLDSLPFL